MDDTVKRGGTLFVSNVNYDTTSADLEAAFSNLAPVRSAFVVSAKGVGYVTLAISEDASRVLEAVKSDGLVVNGRALRADWADARKKRPHTEEDSSAPREAPPPDKKPRLVVHDRDPDATRSIVLLNLPSSVDQKQLWKKARKYAAESVVHPFLADQTMAKVIFDTPAKASAAVPLLHNHTFKGSLIGAMLKKKWDSVVSANAKPGRAGRLIIRNLPWNITHTTLRKIFTPFGPVCEVHIPTPSSTASSSSKPLAHGFAFVTFVSTKDAERAKDNLNESLLPAESTDTNENSSSRTISVEWALSKEKWKSEKEAAAKAPSDSDDESESATTDDVDSDAGEVSEDDGPEESVSGNSESKIAGSEDSDSDLEPHSTQTQKRKLPDPSEGTTVFVRNVPYEATIDDLKALFNQHGAVRYAAIPVDRTTSPPRPRGTAFVCFKTAEDTDRVLELAARVRQTTGILQENPFRKGPSLLTPDPSSASVQPLVLHGRTLDVTKAVPRMQANDLEKAQTASRRESDKRGIWLLKECVPNPRTSQLPPKHIDALLDSYRARKRTLDSNPLLFVSRTRLSIRGLDKWVTQRVLRKWIGWILEQWEKDTAAGLREDIEAVPIVEGVENQRKAGKKRIVQIKIMRDAGRVDSLSVSGKGKDGRSKGFAFVEMGSVEDALRVVRWCLAPGPLPEGDEQGNNSKSTDAMLKYWMEELEEFVDTQRSSNNGEQSDKVKLVRTTLEDLKSKSKKLGDTEKHIIVEFSIENRQVVRTRAMQRQAKGTSADVKQSKPMFDGSRPRFGGRSSGPYKGERKQHIGDRQERKKLSERVSAEKAKAGTRIGSLVGKKRRDRRMKAT